MKGKFGVWRWHQHKTCLLSPLFFCRRITSYGFIPTFLGPCLVCLLWFVNIKPVHSGLLYSESLKGSLSYCYADTWKPQLVFKKLKMNWNNASPSCLSARPNAGGLDQGPQWTCIRDHSSPAHWFRPRSPGNLILCQQRWFRCSVQSDDSGLSRIPNYICKYLQN